MHAATPLPIAPPATQALAPVGVFAQIETKLGQEALRLLSQGSPQQQQNVLDRVRSAPERFQPPVLYVMSQLLFKAGQKDEAAFWFYAGQLRARFDANRCADPTARPAVDVMNQNFGGPINRYLFQDLDNAQALIAKVVEWDRRTPYAYDPRWINLHGVQAVQTAKDPQLAKTLTKESLSLPQSEWPALAEQTRSKFLQGFIDAISQLKAVSK
ncbi:hypothetical protein [Comamonas sp. Y33R10-2]|uniref:hypothetical protein n=1 Tax=Comamonas sp. Y33R10-2 TaxID=2853257 RepID=UPI0021068E92|nr:hypothetical protein [Comamonas sp. Y33R10-2]